ncbi:MAG: hypothetical protein IPM16_11925 [Chloroflexi bacterium]|nr:hypothetical protein [Chloroflexota bacterium]
MNLLSRCLLVTLFGIVLLGLSKAQPTVPSTPVTTPTPTGGGGQSAFDSQSEVKILNSLFAGECSPLCYMGLEPGVTTATEIVSSLEQSNTAYHFEYGVIYWEPELIAGVNDGVDPFGFTITVGEDDQRTVIQVAAPIGVRVSAILQVFGAPEVVTYQFPMYLVGYPDLGLLFFVDATQNTQRASYLFLTEPENRVGMPSHPPGTPVTQECATYDVAPCIAPTATPTAVSTSADMDEQSLSTEGQALLNLFSGPDCQRNCFLGIQPNVTTEQELVDSLVSASIQYYVLPGQIQWYAPDLPLLFSDSAIDVHIVSGMVDQLNGRLDTTVDVVVEVFGSPPVATIHDTAKAATPDLIVIAYPELGLAFYVDRLAGSNDAISFFNLAYPGHGYSWAEDPPGEPLVQDCPTYGTWPCMVATATSTP